MEDLPTPRVPYSIVARRRSAGSANCSISAAFAVAMDAGGMFIGLPSIGGRMALDERQETVER